MHGSGHAQRRSPFTLHLRAAIALLLILAPAPCFFAQPEPTPPTPSVSPPAPGENKTITEEEASRERTRLQREAFAAFDRKDYAAAERALRQLVSFDADNFVPWYNLACALSMQAKTAESLTMLKQAVARGFADRRTMETDEQLEAVRGTEGYKSFVAGFDRMLESRVDARIEQALRTFSSDDTRTRYTVVKDPDLRLVYISAFEKQSFEEAQQQIRRLSRWWERQVLARPNTTKPTDEKASAPTPPPPSPWILIILPARTDYARWAIRRFGEEGWMNVGGLYSHDNKQLVAMDLGATLRHEYWHVLHWRDMDAQGKGVGGQRHPIWLMEGLCSLVEDVKVEGSGDATRFIPTPSWRTNMVKRLSRGASGLMPWDVLMSLDQKRFIGTRPLAQYAQSRAIFCFLFERGKLAEFYTAYTRGYGEDPSGKSAMESVFGKPLKEVNREFIKWVKDQPDVVDVIGRAEANLPFDVAAGAGDGPTVDCPPEVAFISPKMSRSLAGLKHADVIESINGQITRDLNDLARIVGSFAAGQTVDIGYRRGSKRGTVQVTLVGPKS